MFGTGLGTGLGFGPGIWLIIAVAVVGFIVQMRLQSDGDLPILYSLIKEALCCPERLKLHIK